MQRRNSTNPRRLDRRKSAASVKSVHLEHITPETAERDAQVAATQAFARAKARSTTDPSSTLWPPPRCGGSCSSTPGAQQHLKARSEETPFRRQQSIRFVQPKKLNMAPNPTTAQATLASSTPRASKHIAEVGVGPRPSSSISASGMVSAVKGTAGDYINTLFTSDEYYTPQDDIASVPSSYRKLRKSRSMFTDKTIAAGTEKSNLSKSSASANQLPLPADSYSMSLRGNENIPPQGLKAPKSMSFLRDFRGSFVAGFRSEEDTNQATSVNGYDPYQDDTKHHLRPKQSKIFPSKASRPDRVFRKSMRDISDDTAWTGIKIPKDGSLRYKARRVSQGLKHRLKNLFSLGKGDTDDMGLPLQHVDAHKSHLFGYKDLHHGDDENIFRISSAGQAALSHVTSGVPSLHAVPSYQQLHSRQGSMESLQSERKISEDRSRVTSWSNSDANTVITHNSGREEREKKRLSIINEHGAHICSSSAQFIAISEQSNASTASLHQSVQTAAGPVDGRRIYSALMKRLEQSRQQISSLERQSSDDDIAQSSTVPRRKSSLRPRRLGCDASATIRYVMPESESESESPNTKAGLNMKGTQVSSSACNSKSSRPTTDGVKGKEKGQAYPESPSTFTGISLRGMSNGIPSAPSVKGAPQLIQTLSSRSSAFFGSPTRHLFRAQSPYRRALQDRMHTTPNEQSIKSPDFNPWMRSLSNLPNLQLRRSSTYGSDADIKLHYTESIYSTNTEEGQTRRQSFLSATEDFQRPRSTHGDATIFVDQPEYDKRSSSLPPKKRVSSSSSSVEWKMWLSSNVSKLEETAKQVDSNDFQCGLRSTRSSGHVRENAQINDEEEDKLADPPDTPSRIPVNRGSVLNMNNEDEDDDEQPTPFDAGDTRTETERPRLCSTNHLPASISGSNIETSGKLAEESPCSTSFGVLDTNREKELPRVPSQTFKENRTNRLASFPSKLVKHLPKPKNVIEPLGSRVLSSTGEDRHTKMNGSANSRPKLCSVASAKSENVSPAAAMDDDPYGIEGSGVLGPSQQNVGSKRMVDIFLSSRRRRMTSEDEGSVFL